MTRNSDFKHLVRTRMAATGESYTAARAALADSPVADSPVPSGTSYDDARAEQERIVARLFSGGRIEGVPARRRTRAAVLLEVVSRFEPGRSYSEKEVNEVLLGVHADFAYLRRELVNYRYLQRADGIYRVADHAPERSRIEHQEIPAWEAAWFPGFAARA